MNRELILFSGNIIQDSFVKLYFPHDDMHKVVHFEEGARPHFNMPHSHLNHQVN